MKPILVNPSPVPEQLLSGFRDAIKVIGTAVASKGVYDESYAEIGVGLVMLVGPIVWSQFAVRIKQRKMATLAEHAPAAIGDLKR